jgi:hypothetical protein
MANLDKNNNLYIKLSPVKILRLMNEIEAATTGINGFTELEKLENLLRDADAAIKSKEVSEDSTYLLRDLRK